MFISILIRQTANGAVSAVARWLRLQFKIARDRRAVENLPDERLTDIGIDRREIPKALRHGRPVRRASPDAEDRTSAQDPAFDLGAHA